MTFNIWEWLAITYLIGLLVFGTKGIQVGGSPLRIARFAFLWPYFIGKFILNS